MNSHAQFHSQPILLQNLFGLSAPVEIDIRFNGQEQRKLIEAKVDKDRKEKFPLYFDGETVSGKVILIL